MRIASPYQTFDFFLTPFLMCVCPQVRALDKQTCFWLKLAIFVANIYSLFSSNKYVYIKNASLLIEIEYNKSFEITR